MSDDQLPPGVEPDEGARDAVIERHVRTNLAPADVHPTHDGGLVVQGDEVYVRVFSHAPLVPIGDLSTHPDNPRQGDVGALVDMMRANGFYGESIYQESSGQVCIGNHRLLAARALGMPVIPAMGAAIDDERAKRWMLGDNRAADLAAYDDSLLADLLSDLATGTSGALAGTGFDNDALDQLLADVGTAQQFQPSPTPPPRLDESDASFAVLTVSFGDAEVMRGVRAALDAIVADEAIEAADHAAALVAVVDHWSRR